VIEHIYQHADWDDIVAAREYATRCLHISYGDIGSRGAIGYVCTHFEMGALTGWDGFLEWIHDGKKDGNPVL
jgi:hypothetical protein